MHEKWSGDYRKTKWLKTPLDYSLKHARITSIHHLVSRTKRKKFKQVCGYCDWFRWKCDGINRKVNLCEKFHQTTTKRTNTPKRMLRYTCIYFRGASTTAAVVALLLLSVRRVSQKLSSSSSPPKGCFPTDESPRFEFMLLLVGGLQVNCRLFLRMLKWWSVSSELSDGAPPRKLHFTSFTPIQNDDKEEKNVYTEKSLIGETAIVS